MWFLIYGIFAQSALKALKTLKIEITTVNFVCVDIFLLVIVSSYCNVKNLTINNN